MNPLKNVTGAPNTTLGGLIGVVAAVVGQQLVPAIAAYLGAQPNPVFQLIGSVLGVVVAALLPEFQKRYPDPRVPPAALLLLVGALMLPAPATAQEPAQPPPAVQITCFDGAGLYCLRPGISFSGVGYDFAKKSVIKDVVFSGLLELTLGHKIAVVAGGGFQAGEVQGLAAQAGLEYMPMNVAILTSVVVAGTGQSWGINGGYILRF